MQKIEKFSTFIDRGPFVMLSALFAGFMLPIFVVLYGIELEWKCVGFYCSLYGGSLLCVITVWLVSFMVLTSWKYKHRLSDNWGLFCVCVWFVSFCCFVFFLLDNFILLYFFFEMSLIPTAVLIMKWGYQPEKIQATFFFIMYTVCASLPLLVVFLLFTGVTSSFMGLMFIGQSVMGIPTWCLLMAFLVKTPMWGVHLWLPKAHVEAPVSGSMVLAGVLLKLGGVGVLLVVSSCFVGSSVDLFISVSLWGICVVIFICIRSTDVKSLIAYSSVVHMGLMLAGILSGTYVGLVGGVVMMVVHGLVSPIMFVLSNVNYEMLGSRNLLFMKGVGCINPVLGVSWFACVCNNMSVPPVLSFASEVLIVGSILSMSSILCLVSGFATFGSGAYNLFLYSSLNGKCFMVTSGMSDLLVLCVYLCVFPVSFFFPLYLFWKQSSM